MAVTKLYKTSDVIIDGDALEQSLYVITCDGANTMKYFGACKSFRFVSSTSEESALEDACLQSLWYVIDNNAYCYGCWLALLEDNKEMDMTL